MTLIKSLVKAGGKLFGAAAQRVSTNELCTIFTEISGKLGNTFERMQLTRWLPEKTDHGDIDILVLAKPNQNVREILEQTLGNSIKKFSKNSNIHSVLYHSDTLQIDVHVDFLSHTNPSAFDAAIMYFSYNDFSGILGIFAKKLHFKYGSDGFFKRFRDKKGNWHDILITTDLNVGLQILGYTDVKTKFDSIKNIDDILAFIASSPLFDSNYLNPTIIDQSDGKLD